MKAMDRVLLLDGYFSILWVYIRHLRTFSLEFGPSIPLSENNAFLGLVLTYLKP